MDDRYLALLSELLLRKGFFLLGLFDDHGHVVLLFLFFLGRHYNQAIELINSKRDWRRVEAVGKMKLAYFLRISSTSLYHHYHYHYHSYRAQHRQDLTLYSRHAIDFTRSDQSNSLTWSIQLPSRKITVSIPIYRPMIDPVLNSYRAVLIGIA